MKTKKETSKRLIDSELFNPLLVFVFICSISFCFVLFCFVRSRLRTTLISEHHVDVIVVADCNAYCIRDLPTAD